MGFGGLELLIFSALDFILIMWSRFWNLLNIVNLSTTLRMVFSLNRFLIQARQASSLWMGLHLFFLSGFFFVLGLYFDIQTMVYNLLEFSWIICTCLFLRINLLLMLILMIAWNLPKRRWITWEWNFLCPKLIFHQVTLVLKIWAEISTAHHQICGNLARVYKVGWIRSWVRMCKIWRERIHLRVKLWRHSIAMWVVNRIQAQV